MIWLFYVLMLSLQETNAKLSKLRLQVKAKAAKETKAKKSAAEDTVEQVTYL